MECKDRNFTLSGLPTLRAAEEWVNDRGRNLIKGGAGACDDAVEVA